MTKAPSLGGRLGRYARVGASVGGLAARLAGERYLGLDARPRQARGRAQERARRAEGPADEGGAAAGHHSRCAAAGICDASWRSCRPTRRRWAGPSCAGAWRPSWGRTGRRSSSSFDKEASFAASLGQVHRAILPDGRRRGGCKLQYPDMASALEADLDQLKVVFAIGQRFDPAIQHRRDPGRDHGRACARSSTIAARPGTSRSTATCCATSRTCMCPRSCRSCRPTGC